MKLNPGKVALTGGVLLGSWHLLWAVLVAANLAQGLLDFVFGLHMIANPYQVTGFDITKAGMLVVLTFVVGYVVSYGCAIVWNNIHKG